MLGEVLENIIELFVFLNHSIPPYMKFWRLGHQMKDAKTRLDGNVQSVQR
jgi:hypothetical protein